MIRARKENISILDVGGGSRTPIPVEEPRTLTTIDISAEQLEKNAIADEKILGDVETYDFGDRRYDIVSFWDVLEHLNQPGETLSRMANLLNDDGLLVIKGPITSSTKGLITRFTPHAVHVLFYRHILGSEHAGKPGYAPWPVEFKPGSDLRSIMRYIKANDLHVLMQIRFEIWHVAKLREKSRVLSWLYSLGNGVLRLVSAGRLGGKATDFVIVASRQQN